LYLTPGGCYGPDLLGQIYAKSLNNHFGSLAYKPIQMILRLQYIEMQSKEGADWKIF
jgi:hypothetical protein